MNIGSIGLNSLKNIAKSENKTSSKAYLLKQGAKDTVQFTGTHNKKEVEEAKQTIKNMKNSYGEQLFNDSDIKMFEKFYKQDAIDVKTVEKLANKDYSLLNMADFSGVYIMGKALKDNNFVDTVSKSLDKVLNLSTDKKIAVATIFDRDTCEPNNEFAITYSYVDAEGRADYDKHVAQFDKEGNLVAKTKIHVDPKRALYIEQSVDYRNNTKAVKVSDITPEGYPSFKQEVIIHNDANGKEVRRDVMSESEVEGVLNVRYEYPNGKVEDIAKATIDPKTGIKTIKKDMKSIEGTRTEYLYEDDPNGNRLIDYKITDKDGKVLYKNSQTFEVISDNKFISSKDHREYEITTNDKELRVKDLSHDKEAVINFKDSITGNRKDIVEMLKKLPGEELFNVVDAVSYVGGLDKSRVLDAYYLPFRKNIVSAGNLSVFLHELGHAKDHEKTRTNGGTIFTDDPVIKKTYEAERKIFNQNFAPAQRAHIDYFNNSDPRLKNGLIEVVAETNMLTNTYVNGEAKVISDRGQYLQQHFPKTIAAIKEAMEYKNDLAAMEYYGEITVANGKK